jgi:hypothetical protein
MLSGKRVRLQAPTVAIARDERGCDVAVLVPAGGIVRLMDDVSDENRLVLVDWGGRVCQMFSVDLRERGLVVARAAAGN